MKKPFLWKNCIKKIFKKLFSKNKKNLLVKKFQQENFVFNFIGKNTSFFIARFSMRVVGAVAQD